MYETILDPTMLQVLVSHARCGVKGRQSPASSEMHTEVFKWLQSLRVHGPPNATDERLAIGNETASASGEIKDLN